jgi:hypothetical protein
MRVQRADRLRRSSRGNGELSREIVEAEEIAARLSEGDGTVFTLRDKIVSGRLDLRHYKIRVAVEIQDCEFQDAVDLRYCEFERVVDLTGCTFHGEFNSGDEERSHTVFHKDLICDGARFEGSVHFNGCRVESSASFSGARFLDADETTNFGWLNVEKTLEFDDAIFRGPTDFNSVQCAGLGYFSGAKFEGQGPISFHTARFGNNLICQNTVFKGPVDFQLLECGGAGVFDNAVFGSTQGASFVQASFGSNFQCTGATFEGPATLNSLRCDRSGLLARTTFNEQVDLGFAFFGESLDCSGTTFAKAATFGHLHCENLGCEDVTFDGHVNIRSLRCTTDASFDRSEFRGMDGADFSHASIGRSLSCKETVFHNSISFGSVKCGGSAFFHGARFLPEGNVTFAHSSFSNTLECQQATFEGSSSFNSLRCVGVGHFTEATFEGKAEFSNARFDGGLSCESVSFAQSVDLFRIECADINFRNAVFRGPANLNSIRCGGAGFFSGAEFRSRVDLQFSAFGSVLRFGEAKFRGRLECFRLECDNLECNNTTFEGPTNFRSSKCHSGGFFRKARFKEETDFGHALFGVTLRCDGAVFGKEARFGSLDCGQSGFFRNVEFADVDFRYASFGLNLDCQESTFLGSTNFASLRCKNSGFFIHATFGPKRVSWRGASFGGNLEFLDAIFQGEVNLNGTQCQGAGRFDRAKFNGLRKADFAYAYFGINLVLSDAIFACPVDCTMMRVERGLHLGGATFNSDIALNRATVGVLSLARGVRLKAGRVDLRGFEFRSLLGEVKTAEAFVRAQDPALFSREPYLQLERFYKSVGDEVEAKRTHYQGRKDLRDNAKSARGAANWSLWANVGDFFLKYLTGYGVRTWRLLFYIGFFLIVGTCVFWSADSVRPGNLATTDPITATKANEGNVAPSRSEKSSAEQVWRPLNPFAYSLDLFLPVVNLRYDEMWTPVGDWRAAFALLHSMAGWLLVPLLVASLAGIVRRE